MISAKLKRNTYSDDDIKHWGSRKACMELLWCSPATERTLLRLCVATAAVHDIKTRRNAGQEKDNHGEPLKTVEIRDCFHHLSVVRFLSMLSVGVCHLFCFNRRPAALRRRHPLSLF